MAANDSMELLVVIVTHTLFVLYGESLSKCTGWCTDDFRWLGGRGRRALRHRVDAGGRRGRAEGQPPAAEVIHAPPCIFP